MTDEQVILVAAASMFPYFEKQRLERDKALLNAHRHDMLSKDHAAMDEAIKQAWLLLKRQRGLL